MTQLECDKKMQELDAQFFQETHQLRERLNEINRQNSEVKQKICELKIQQMSFSREYHDIPDKIHSIKQVYADKRFTIQQERNNSRQTEKTDGILR